MQQVAFHHLLSTNDLSVPQIQEIMDLAASFFEPNTQALKKIPLLRGKTVATLFFEPSTRTRTTFELAAKRLSADVLNVDIGYSSSKKGESLLDTVYNLKAMQVDMFVLRHPESGAAHFLSENLSEGSVINAGDGCHQHPTQALLDVFTILKHKGCVSGLVVAILGDVEHSRVARSQLHLLLSLGVKAIHIIAPPTLFTLRNFPDTIKYFDRIEEGLMDVDVVIVLRLQKERMERVYLPSFEEYFMFFGLTQERLRCAKADAIVMHPGPVNRSVEIVSEIVDGDQSVILEQVTNGIAVRMAVMTLLANSIQKTKNHDTHDE